MVSSAHTGILPSNSISLPNTMTHPPGGDDLKAAAFWGCTEQPPTWVKEPMLNDYARRLVATIRDQVEVRNMTNASPFETASAMAPGSTPSRILAADGDSSDSTPMMFDHTVLDCSRFLISFISGLVTGEGVGGGGGNEDTPDVRRLRDIGRSAGGR